MTFQTLSKPMYLDCKTLYGWVCLPISQSKARTHSPHTHLPFINKSTKVGLSFSRLSHAHSLQHPPVPFRRLPTYAGIILIERYASKQSSHCYIDMRASASNQNKGVRDTPCHRQAPSECTWCATAATNRPQPPDDTDT